MGSCCGVYFCVNKFNVGKPRPLPYTQPGDRPRSRVRRDDCRLSRARRLPRAERLFIVTPRAPLGALLHFESPFEA